MNFTMKLLPLVIAVVFCSCSPKYYTPNTQNVPIIHEKGQTNLTFAGNDNQVEFQGAYGISNSLAIQLNGGFFIPKNEGSGDGGSGRILEAGLGYYKNIGDALLFDTYLLVGLGKMENHFPSSVTDYPNTTGKLTADVLRFGIQPSLSFHRKYFSLSLSSRITSVNYSNIEGSLIYASEDQARYLNDNKSNFMIEPAITVRGGTSKFKLQVQIARPINVTHPDFKQDKGLITIGLNFNFL